MIGLSCRCIGFEGFEKKFLCREIKQSRLYHSKTAIKNLSFFYFWGEDPNGIWLIEIFDNANKLDPHAKHRTRSWVMDRHSKFAQSIKLTIHGTSWFKNITNNVEINRPDETEGESQTSGSNEINSSESRPKISENVNTPSNKDEISTLIHHSKTCRSRYLEHFKNYSKKHKCHELCHEDTGCCGPTQGDCFKCKYVTYTTKTRCLSVCPEEMYDDGSGVCQLCKPELGVMGLNFS